MVATLRDRELLTLLIAHRAELVSYARAIVGDTALAEDVVQDAYFRLERAQQVKLDDKLDEPVGYIFRIVRNLAIDGRRRIGRENTFIQGDANGTADMVAAEGPDPEEKAIARGQVRLLEKALSQLPEKSRIALEMHRFGGCKYAEIAKRLDVSVGTAHGLVTDAIEHCKQILAKGG
ncbi:sigma-70 family RNA polymerase sigma factor [Thalassospira sp.]|uniref:sigma-70 family RNA polymerase sigma factor n=1 Tax=Thalassospira sp. TaxID=1912094 RepID=UPI000C583AB1|nr:sigma-70 family RNA polymerase sigma factor [Thalassospira sp.]MBC04878.1 RNA polymerase subunit sigma-24 [Thalassospira sp.]|tara:strand:+ start:4980 stop:5510 length:531 start_codon:yes stop_codon:yes gene_type:complete